jgi:hypothetical protein
MPIVAAALMATTGTLATLDIRKEWAEYATGVSLIAGLVAVGASFTIH